MSSAGCDPERPTVEGVSTRRVDDRWPRPWGVRVSPRSQVSRICQELDVVVDGFLEPSAGRWTLSPTCGWTLQTQIIGQGVTAGSSTSAWSWRRRSMARASRRSWPWLMDVGTSEVRRLLAGLPGHEFAVRQGPQWGGAGGIGRSSGTLRQPSPQSSAEPAGNWCRTHFMTNLLTRVPPPGAPSNCLGGHHGRAAPSTSNPPNR